MRVPNDHALAVLSREVAERLLSAKRRLATAESCTGGLVAAALTAIAGSSDVVERSFVTYSTEAKIDLLGVSPDTIAAHGAVSAQTWSAVGRSVVASRSATGSATGAALRWK